MGASGAGAGVSAAPAGLGTLMFRMEVAGFESVTVSLSRYGERIQDFRLFWREYFAPSFYRDVQRNFETEGSYVSGWAKLAEPYATWKAKHYPGRTILRRTDALFRSMQFDGTNAGPRGIFRAEPRQLEVGTSVPWGQFLQVGTSRMVARPFLFIGRNARSTFGRLLHRYAVDQFQDEGRAIASTRARAVTSGLL